MHLSYFSMVTVIIPKFIDLNLKKSSMRTANDLARINILPIELCSVSTTCN